MNKLVLLLLVGAWLQVSWSRYVAIPLEDLQVVEVAEEDFPASFQQQQQAASSPGHLVVRRAAPEEVLVEAESQRQQRGVGSQQGYGHDYVDYSAYTGGHGAFGWHSDHPVGYGGGHH